jgi:hypothetical protein
LIADAIARVLAPRLGVVKRAARAAGVESVTIAGALKMDLGRIGKADGVTLPDALRALHEAARAPVALIVDEAQHALTSDAGEATLSALKSARDQLNRPGEVNLMLVMSGSDRDKLLRLVNTNGAPFYGSQISRMPSLGQDFIDHVARLIAQQRPQLEPIDRAALMHAFEGFGQRPQFFMDALSNALSPLSGLEGTRFEQAALRPLEQAVLWRLLEQGPRFRAYDSDALRFYVDRTTGRVTPQMVQRALESLRARTPALVWKSARGEYSVDDAAMHRWFEELTSTGSWPPVDPQGQLVLGDQEP